MAQKFPIPHSTVIYAAKDAYGFFCMRGKTWATSAGCDCTVDPIAGTVTVTHLLTGATKTVPIRKAWRPGA